MLLHFLIKNKKPTKNESHRQEETLIKYCESQKVILQFKGNLKNDHVYSSFFLYFSPVITAHWKSSLQQVCDQQEK